MKTTYSITFVCRPSKVGKKSAGKAPIEMIINLNGERVIFTLPRKEEPSEFSRSMKSKKRNEIKDYCDLSYNETQSFLLEMQERKIPLSIPNIKQYIQKGFTDSYTIGELITEYMEFINLRLNGKVISAGSAKLYKQAFNYLLKSIPSNTEVSSINSTQIQSIVSELTAKYKNSTAFNIYSKIQTLFKYAFEIGKIKQNPTSLIKLRRTPKDAVYLTEEELSYIEHSELTKKAHIHYRDLFIFQAHTCLSFSDLKSLSKDDIQENEYGKYIRKQRQKTKVVYTILLDDTALRILEKYNYNLNVKTVQCYNMYLSEIEKELNLSKHISSHTARHSGATYLLNNGTPIEMVSKILGHTNITQSQHYAKMLDKSVLKSMAELEDRKREQKEVAEKYKKRQQFLKLVRDNAGNFANMSDSDIADLFDEIISDEPFNGSLERDFLEEQLMNGDITQEEFDMKLENL